MKAEGGWETRLEAQGLQTQQALWAHLTSPWASIFSSVSGIITTSSCVKKNGLGSAVKSRLSFGEERETPSIFVILDAWSQGTISQACSSLAG